MDITYSEEQQMLQDSVRKFLQKNYDFDKRRTIIDSEAGFLPENWNQFAELGWLAVPFKEEDGGFGGNAVDLLVMMEEFGKGLVVEPFVATTILCGGLIAELGTAEQKQGLLPDIIAGNLQLACAFTEMHSRFNLAAVKTRASLAGEEYTLSGQKSVVLNGGQADKLLVVARTSGGDYESSGVSLFCVDAKAKGIRIRKYQNVDGHQAAEIDFDAVVVSRKDLFGEEGKALPALERAIDRATFAVSAEAVGIISTLLAKTVEYAKTRKQFGTYIGSFQALQHRMADMFIESELCKSIVMMAA